MTLDNSTWENSAANRFPVWEIISHEPLSGGSLVTPSQLWLYGFQLFRQEKAAPGFSPVSRDGTGEAYETDRQAALELCARFHRKKNKDLYLGLHDERDARESTALYRWSERDKPS